MVSSSLSMANFNKVDEKSIFCAIFDEKSLNFENFIKHFSQKKTSIKQFSIALLSLVVTTTLCR